MSTIKIRREEYQRLLMESMEKATAYRKLMERLEQECPHPEIETLQIPFNCKTYRFRRCKDCHKGPL